MKENLKLREAVFRKMGWEPGLKMDQGQWWLVVNLPMVEKRWEVTAKYLVVFMFNWCYDIKYHHDSRFYFTWYGGHMSMDRTAEIKDNNISLAACKAFLEVEI